MTKFPFKENDVRLWDHEPLRWQRWVDAKTIRVPVNGGWVTFPDGSHMAEVGGHLFSFPAWKK